MKRTTERRMVAIAGLILAGVALGLGSIMTGAANRIDTFKVSRARGLTDFGQPVVAMELPQTPEDVRLVIGESAGDAELVREVQRADSWFIAAYTALLLALIRLAALGRPRAIRWLAGLGVVATLAAAVFDFRENRAILDMLGPAGPAQAGVDAIRTAASVKWTAFYLGAGIIGLILMMRPYRRTRPRILIAVAGNLLALGMVLGLGFWFVPPAVTLGLSDFPVVPAAILIVLLVALFRPEAFDEPERPAQEEEPAPSIAKVDHLLSLAQAALEEIAREPKGELARAFEERLERHVERVRSQAPAHASDALASKAAELPGEVRLEIAADLLLADRREDAIRLARSRLDCFPPVISRVAGAVVEALAHPGERAEALRAALKAGGLPDACPANAGEMDALRRTLGQELLLKPSVCAHLAHLVGTAAVPFALALQAELDEIQRSRAKRLAPGEAPGSGARPRRYSPRLALDLGLSGLAFSGGGIRSATFNLGILQALADLRLLQRFDYLSTVSGGGYIGSWLVSWAKRLGGGIAAVQEFMSPRRTADPATPSARPVRFLREYSNYLTPRLGLLGADTWTLISIWFRNTLLNQTVLVLMLGAVLLVPRAIGLLLLRSESWPAKWIWAIGAVGLACFLIVCLRSATELGRFLLAERVRSVKGDDGDWAPAEKAGYSKIQMTIIFPGFACGLLLAVPLWYWTLRGWATPPWAASFGSHPLIWVGASAAVLFALGLIVIEFRAGYARRLLRGRRNGRELLSGILTVVLSTFGPAVVGGGLMMAVAGLYGRWAVSAEARTGGGAWHVITLGAPLIIEVLALSAVFHIGLLGRGLDDDRREWWSRLGAWLLIWSIGWMAAFGVAVYGPFLATRLAERLAAAGGLAWLASSAWGAYVAQSSSRSAAGGGTGDQPSGWKEMVAKIAPPVFVIGLLVLIALGLHALLASLEGAAAGFAWQIPSEHYWAQLSATGLGWTAALLAAFLAAGLLLAWRVDVNEFSMHNFYKNRLVRCYLGATREGAPVRRRAHPFTGFDHRDDLLLATLRTEPAPGLEKGGCASPEEPQPYVGPLPIVNTALNLVKGDDLAWQERKAQSFIFTPIFSGYERMAIGSRRAPDKSDLAEDGFRPTCAYGYPNGGIHLGTAMAISGAAANPSMGYHTSAPAAFLMTMFNVRLGWWMGNPRQKAAWQQSSPTFGLSALVAELTGNTTNRSRFVNLSDGGHFENLGLYELVRRRCRYIVACDAEQDADLGFNGLGNAVRKCRTDFGVEIVLRPTPIFPVAEGKKESRAHAVLGDILYPGGDRGVLLYLKSSLTGDEPADVLEYSKRVKAFPHESTGDQFFDESQFEAYRQLGYHIAHSLFDEAVPRSCTDTGADASLGGILERLGRRAPAGAHPVNAIRLE